jgi:hypothetical protein
MTIEKPAKLAKPVSVKAPPPWLSAQHTGLLLAVALLVVVVGCYLVG